MALTPLHVQSYCSAGENGCRYLQQKWIKNDFLSLCTKLHPALKQKVNEKLKSNKEAYSSGDNCKGFLYLVHAKQGFDVKGSR